MGKSVVIFLRVAFLLSIIGLSASQQHCYSCAVTIGGSNSTSASSVSISTMIYSGSAYVQATDSLLNCPVYACTAVFDSCMAQQIGSSPMKILYACQIYLNCLNIQQYGTGSLNTVTCCLGQTCNHPLSTVPQDPAYSAATTSVVATCLIVLNAVIAALLS